MEIIISPTYEEMSKASAKAVAEAYRQLSTTVRSDLTWPEAGAAVAPRGPAGG